MKVKCFQCGEVISLEEAIEKRWYVNVSKWTEGFFGTCPDCLNAQRKPQRTLDEF